MPSNKTKPGAFRTLVNFLSQEDVLGPQINSAKVKALQLYLPLHFQILRVKTLFSSGDPWSLTSLTSAIGLRNWFPIHHTLKDYSKVDPTPYVDSSELSVAQVFRVRDGLGSPQDLRNTPYVRDTNQIPAFDFDTANALAAAFDLDGDIAPAPQTPEEVEIEMKKLAELWTYPRSVGEMTPFIRKTGAEKEAEVDKESWVTSIAQQEKREERHPQLPEGKALDKTIQDIVDASGTVDPN